MGTFLDAIDHRQMTLANVGSLGAVEPSLTAAQNPLASSGGRPL